MDIIRIAARVAQVPSDVGREMTWEDAQGPTEEDAELAKMGLRAARLDPDTGKIEEGASRVTLEDGTSILAVKDVP